MAYSEELVNRVREAFAAVPDIEEKRMFSGITFMINGKMCVSVGKDRIMCRIDPILHDQAVEKNGARTVQMKGRDYRGYVYVSEDAIKTKKDFDYWINLSLDFNKKAKASKPAAKKIKSKK